MFDLLVVPVEVESYIPQKTQSFLQKPFWAEFKKRNGWSCGMFNVSGKIQGCEFEPFTLTVLLKEISVFGFIAYVPLGPNIFFDKDFSNEETAKTAGKFLSELSEKLKSLLPKNVFCIRFDPPWKTEVLNSKGKKACNEQFPKLSILKNASKKILKAKYDVQPPDSVHLDLTVSDSELEADLKSKWRYNIRLANKKGVEIKRLTGEDAKTTGVDIFYKLYTETAKRDGIAIHSKAYYESLLSLAQNSSSKYNTEVAVYLAIHEGDYLAGIIVISADTQAVYLYGASSNKKRNLMSTYALQWQAICDAKKNGAEQYDFYGIPPLDEPSHPMYGLYRFKTGFGGKIVHFVGSLDVELKPLSYKMYSIAENLRSTWYKRLKKLLKRV